MSSTTKRTRKRKRRTWLMPQEVEVWYVIPAIRRELARIMIGKERPQKQIARMLGVTEPAVTQYKLEKSKRSRGDQIKISKEFYPELEKSVNKILDAWDTKKSDSDVYLAMTREINRIIRVLRDAGALCEVHRDHCDSVHPECNACKDGRR